MNNTKHGINNTNFHPTITKFDKTARKICCYQTGYCISIYDFHPK